MYTLSSDPHLRHSSKIKKKHHRRGKGNTGSGSSSEKDDDGANSLTYSSAASSIASSAAGESTDSSFADVMRVLDLQDNNELAYLMKKDGGVDSLRYAQMQQQKRLQASTASVAESLAYSTDGESALGGEHLLQTITG